MTITPPGPLAAVAAPVERAVARGSLWLIAMGMLSRALGIVGTLLLTHLIAPSVYGEVSDAVVVTFTINALANVGVGVYVLAHADAGPEEMFHAAVVHIGLAALFLVPLYFAGARLGLVLGAPKMSRYMPGLMVAVMCERINYLPDRLLLREMRFRGTSLARAGTEILCTVVSVAGAYFGLEGMAVVWGNIARSAGRVPFVFMMISWRRWLRPYRLRLSIIRRIVRFGIPLSLGQLVGFGIRRWDNLVVSHLHGAAAVGAYNLAYNLADIPAVQIGEQITDALQVAYARNNEGDPLRRLLRSIGVLAFIMTPMAVGLGTIAPTLAKLSLNSRWAGTGAMLMWLSVISFPRPLSGAVASYMQVRDQKRAFLALELFTLAMLFVSLFTIGRIGPIAACIAVGATFMARLLATSYLLWLTDRVKPWAFFAPQVPPLAASLVMAGVVAAAAAGLERVGAPLSLSLVAQIAVGVLAYAGAAWLIARRASAEIVALAKSAISQRRRRS